MEATKWLKPSVAGQRIADRASVQAAKTQTLKSEVIH
jgi:hypothetical protein